MVGFVDNLDQRIKDFISVFEAELFTAMPGVVEDYNPDNQEASVKPAIDTLFRDQSTRSFQILDRLPVLFPSTSNSCVSMPLAKGDSVLIVWSQRSTDNWQNQNEVSTVNPKALRKHHFTDAFCIPGVWPTRTNPIAKYSQSGSPSSDLIIFNGAGSAPTSISLKADGTIKIENNTTDIEVANGVTTINSASVIINGNLQVTGTIVSDTSVAAPSILANGKELTNHTHSGVTPGAGNTGPNN